MTHHDEFNLNIHYKNKRVEMTKPSRITWHGRKYSKSGGYHETFILDVEAEILYAY